MNVAGIQLSCEICKHDHFFSREAQLNTPAMTLFDLDWMNATATCAVCAKCGYVHCIQEVISWPPMDPVRSPHPHEIVRHM